MKVAAGNSMEVYQMIRLFTRIILVGIAVFFTSCANNTQKPSPPPTVNAAATTESTANLEQEVRKADEAYEKAWVQQDAAAFDQLLADDYIYTNGEGTLTTKADVLKDARAGDYKFEYGRSEEKKIRVYGNTAVLNGIWVDKGINKGKAFSDRQRYTTVYVKKNGNWQVVSDQVTNSLPPKP